MDARAFFDNTDEMPLPPVVFLLGKVSATGQVIAIPEERLIRTGSEYYTVLGDKDDGTGWVAAGISNWMLKRKSCISFPEVDMHIMAYLWYLRLFKGDRSEVYSSAVDEMYDSVFYKSFGFALSGGKHGYFRGVPDPS